MGGGKKGENRASGGKSETDSLLSVNAIGALKLKPAAKYLGGLSVPTMHRLVKRGLLTPNRATRHLLFRIEDLNRFLRGPATRATHRARARGRLTTSR